MLIELTGSPFPQFSPDEYARRYREVRSVMRGRGLDALLIAGNSASWNRGWCNIRYLSGFVGSHEQISYALVPLEGDPTLIIGGANLHRAGERSVVGDVRGGTDYAGLIVERLAELGLGNATIGTVGVDRFTGLPENHMIVLRRSFPGARFQDVTDTFNGIRAVKSAEEVQSIERAAGICDAGFVAAVEQVVPGMTEFDVFAIMQGAMFRKGGEGPFMTLIASASMETPAAKFPRPYPTSRVIGTGDIIINEAAPKCHDGYGAQGSRPITLGKPNRRYADMFKAALDLYHSTVDALRVGNTDQDVLAGRRIIENSGYELQAPLLHGYGLSLEEPIIGLTYWPVVPTVFKPGTVVVVESSLRIPNMECGLHFGDTYVIEESGARRLTGLPKEILVI